MRSEKRSRRRLEPILVGAIAALVLAGVVVVWASPGARDGLSAFGAFAVALLSLVAAMARGLYHRYGPPPERSYRLSAADLEARADALAEEVTNTWTPEAHSRNLIADALPFDWRILDVEGGGSVQAVLAPRDVPPPIPGAPAVTEAGISAGGGLDALYAIYRGLPSGRLVLLGPPGAGKTATALRLMLRAAGHRREQSTPSAGHLGVPVVAAVSLNDINEDDLQDLSTWLARSVATTYPVITEDESRQLLERHLVCVIMDGLDELSPERRTRTLQAIDQQLVLRFMLLSRETEFRCALQDGQILFRDALLLELQAVRAATAAEWLRSSDTTANSDSVESVVKRILSNPDGPLALALRSPLMLSLFRAGYTRADASRLLELDKVGHRDARRRLVENLLLDRLLASQYDSRTATPPAQYTEVKARTSLTVIAKHMTQQSLSQDLRWRQIAEWLPGAPRWIVTSVGFAIAASAALAIPSRTHARLSDLLLLIAVFAAALVGGVWSRKNQVTWNWVPLRRRLRERTDPWPALFVAYVLAFSSLHRIRAAVEPALVQLIPYAIACAISAGVLWRGYDTAGAYADRRGQTPIRDWRRAMRASVVTGLIAFALVGIVPWLTTWPLGYLTAWMREPARRTELARPLEFLGRAIVDFPRDLAVGLVVALAVAASASAIWTVLLASGHLWWRFVLHYVCYTFWPTPIGAVFSV